MTPANFQAVRRLVLMIAALVVLTSCVYWCVYDYPFISYDDQEYVYNNPHVQQGFSSQNIHYAFVTYAVGNWNPLLWISFYVDRALFHAHSGPMHVENVLWHLISGLLLWRFLQQATGSFYRSFVVAGLFLCHPMHVESVAWIAERKDVLSTPFLIAAMLAYVQFARAGTTRSRWLAYLAMALLFVISLLVKTMGITLPAVLLLLDFWPLRRWPGKSWIKLTVEKIPLMLISLLMLCMGVRAQRFVGAATSLHALSLMDRASNAIVCYVLYVSKLIVPCDLAVLYPHPGIRPAAAVFASLVLLAMVSFFVLKTRRKYPYAVVGWLWFLGTLVPVIGLFQVGGQSMADRYSYFPSIGLFILLVWGGRDLLDRIVDPQRDRKTLMLVQAGLSSAVLIVLAALGHIQVGYWKNTEALFRHDLDVTENNATADIVLGGVDVQQGNMKAAVDKFNAALRLGPNARANFALGNCWLPDNPELARNHFRKAVELDPRSIEYRIGYADALLKAGDKSGALAQARAALEVDPTDPSATEEWQQITGGR